MIYYFVAFRGGWVADPLDTTPWIQARFDTIFKIVAIQTQGRNGKYRITGELSVGRSFQSEERQPEYVKRYKIGHSLYTWPKMENREWVIYKNDDGSERVC